MCQSKQSNVLGTEHDLHQPWHLQMQGIYLLCEADTHSARDGHR